MNDKQVQDLIRGQFMNAVILRMWDNFKQYKVQLREQVQSDDEPYMAEYYREQHAKKHKRKLP